MKKRGIIFTNKKHPKIAIMSTVLGGISVVALLAVTIASFAMRGEIPLRFGVVGMLAFLYSLVGIVMALYSFKIKETFRTFGTAGLILNGVALLYEAFIIWIPG